MPVLGQPLTRPEGRLKVTGRANYAADNPAERIAHACGVMSTIASGEIARLDPSAAEKAPGVLAVFHHGNIPRLHRCPDDMDNNLKTSEDRPPFADNKSHYAGQFVALVVAETFEQARWASHLVHVDYRPTPPALALDDGIRAHGEKPQPDEAHTRGDPDRALAGAPARIDATYTTPVEVHSAMELHAALAQWDGDRLTIHDSTQWVVGQPATLAYVLGIPAENVTVHAPFVGGGFGGKLFLWPHSTLAAVAARQLHRPVKLALARQHAFTTAGHRPCTRQRIQLGATRDGALTAIRHDSHSHTSLVTDFVESCGEATPSLYACPNVAVTQAIVPVNVGSPTPMRGPGATPGTFALESALDELALQLGLDPLELRLKNLPPRDGASGRPWSAIHFEECLRTAADRFGWSRRSPVIGSMRDGREVLGWGLAAATWPGTRDAASARVEFRDDGTVRVACATQDPGTGTYTVIAQVVSELTGLPFKNIHVESGRSDLPPGPISGGSAATATVVPAIAQATRTAIGNLLAAAAKPGGPFAGAAAGGLTFQEGDLVSGSRRATFADTLRGLELDHIAGEASTEPGDERKRYAFRSFGAHCVEVRWDPEITRLRVSRVVSAIDVGRIVNLKTARNQVEGSIMMGLGMALLERAVYDPRHGRVVTDNLADYLVPVHADLPEIDVTLLDRPDPHIGDFGARGVGEIGLTGVAAAIANAVHHATGQRHRDLPITIEKLLG